jgi:hypothetical protein
VIGYLVFPTAPPRLSDIGVLDPVSDRQVDLNTGTAVLSTSRVSRGTHFFVDAEGLVVERLWSHRPASLAA